MEHLADLSSLCGWQQNTCWAFSFNRWRNSGETEVRTEGKHAVNDTGWESDQRRALRYLVSKGSWSSSQVHCVNKDASQLSPAISVGFFICPFRINFKFHKRKSEKFTKWLSTLNVSSVFYHPSVAVWFPSASVCEATHDVTFYSSSNVLSINIKESLSIIYLHL